MKTFIWHCVAKTFAPDPKKRKQKLKEFLKLSQENIDVCTWFSLVFLWFLASGAHDFTIDRQYWGISH